MQHEPSARPRQATSEPLVFRQVAFPVASFDYLKAYQRAVESNTGERLNNNQILALILAEHQQFNVERGVRNEQAKSQARC